MQEVSFVVGGQKLLGTIFYPKKLKDKNPAVLFMHGWTSERKRSVQYAEALVELGFICMTFDMRGHGESEGDINKFTIKDFLDDVITAYDFLLTVEGVDKKNISAAGSSFGCYLLTLFTEKREVKNLSLRAPSDYPNEEFENSKYLFSGTDNPSLFDWRMKPKKYNDTLALSAIHKFNGSIQIIESELDNSVPHQTIQNYIDAIKDKSKLTHIVMKDAPHSIKPGRFRNEVAKILANWFIDKL